jgi:hypothetical protein
MIIIVDRYAVGRGRGEYINAILLPKKADSTGVISYVGSSIMNTR